MSIPSGILRYAGVWDVTITYQYGMVVQSSFPGINNSYVLVVATLTGGSDPSVPDAAWVLLPSSSGGGGGGVTSINGLTGATNVLAYIDDALSSTVYSGNDITIGYSAGSKGIYTEATGGSDTITITDATACKAGWVVQLTYVHAAAGGGPQYFRSITTSDGSFTVVCNTAIDIGDQIYWHVIGIPNPSPAPPPV